MRVACLLPGRPTDNLRPVMPNIHDDPAALKALQDAIYRDKILRARRMTPEQRFSEALDVTNEVFSRMHAGAMWQTGTTDPEQGWLEVRRRLLRLYRARDHGRFTTERPLTS